MNSIVKSALDKLIQDETFRTELMVMVDGVNRTAADPESVSREAAAPDPVPDAFADIKSELLTDPAFLTALTDALMALNAPKETERATAIDTKTAELDGLIVALKGEVEKLRNDTNELSATVTEHDAVLIEMAEGALVSASNQPARNAETFRARVNGAKSEESQVPDLSARAAKVLTKIGAK